jgi:hypothetical protein
MPASGSDLYSGCLFSETDGTDFAEGCSADPLKLKDLSEIRQTLNGLKIDPGIVEFIGCHKASFSTRQAPNPTMRAYIIRYPILQGSDAVDYIAPLTHELSHVFQIEDFNGMAKLKSQLESKRRELGADYISGIVFKNYSEVGKIHFQSNMSLIGRYRETPASAHGTPSERNQAFRRGVYIKFDEFKSDLKQAHTFFQDNIYGEISKN